MTAGFKMSVFSGLWRDATRWWCDGHRQHHGQLPKNRWTQPYRRQLVTLKIKIKTNGAHKNVCFHSVWQIWIHFQKEAILWSLWRGEKKIGGEFLLHLSSNPGEYAAPRFLSPSTIICCDTTEQTCHRILSFFAPYLHLCRLLWLESGKKISHRFNLCALNHWTFLLIRAGLF